MIDHETRNNELLNAVRAGDEGARTALAETNIGLVFAVADQIITRNGKSWQEREELIERGHHGLCRACARIENVRRSVGGYLRAAIHNAMVQRDPGLIKWLPKDKYVWPLAMDVERVVIDDPLQVFWNAADTLSLIYFLCNDTTDRIIVDLRLGGLSMPKVGQKLGIHPETVRRRLLRLEVEFWRVRRGEDRLSYQGKS